VCLGDADGEKCSEIFRGEGVIVELTGYNAVIRQDGPWWIGWIEEVPGVNSQGSTRDELLSNLREALAEAIELNREDARKAAGDSFEEVSIQP
jgi:predicted RNase H-like HicB family nuclease